MVNAIRISLASMVVLVFAVSASAYTLVLMNGRRVEIPADFQVSKSTLTYQVSTDIQVTLQLRTINIPATERANGEAPGSFLRRAGGPTANPVITQSSSATGRATRTLTNRELEPYARIRRESAHLYERRRKELGLPSVEETRLRNQAESELLRQQLEDSRIAQSEEEQYWRGRASDLRGDLSALDAEIAFVRARIDEISVTPNSFTIVNDIFPIGGFGRSLSRRGYRSYPNVYSRGYAPLGVTLGTGYSGTSLQARFGGQPYRFNGRSTRGFGSFNQYGNPFLLAPPFQNLTSFGSPNDRYDSTYERETLVVRLDELVGRRAALRARWRDLEEEARRAGAMPGWLRQ
jgi:hypothetical protein